MVFQEEMLTPFGFFVHSSVIPLVQDPGKVHGGGQTQAWGRLLFLRTRDQEGLMELQDYCRNLQEELSGWRSKVDDVRQRLDKLDTADKATIVSQVNDLHIIVEELGDRISRLEKECPVAWHPQKEEIQNKLQAMGYHWEETWQHAVGGNVGG